MRTDRRKLMVSSRKNDMYELLGKVLRFHPYIDKSYSKLISSWDTSKVTSLSCCFQECSSLQSLDLSSWDTSKVTDLSLTNRNQIYQAIPNLQLRQNTSQILLHFLY